MTDWTDKLLVSGSGFVAYRLMVEGWPHEWVTDPRITHNVGLDLRLTYPGLLYEGLRISEHMVLREGWPEVGGITARIVPTDANEDTLNSFTRDPRVVSSLASPLLATDTTWTTKPAFSGAGIYHLGSECVFVAVDGTTITRGYWDTEPQDHQTSEGLSDNPVPIYNWPPTMEGRRAYLYAYGSIDDADSDGEIIWRGVVTRPPRMDRDGVGWTIEIAPITSKFDQTVGASDELSYRLRGVYRSSSAPMHWSLITNTDALVQMGPIALYGFYENQDQFAADMNAQLITAVTAALGLATSVTSVTMDYATLEDRYSFYFILDAGHDDFPLRMGVFDIVDGDTQDSGGQGDPFPNGSPPYSGFSKYFAGNATGEFYTAMNRVKAPYGYPLPQARTFVGKPTARKKNKIFNRFIGGSYSLDDPTWPNNRVYLEEVDGLGVGDVLLVKNGDKAEKRMLRITAIETINRYLTVDLVGPGDAGIYITSDSEIVPLKIYGDNNNWATFIQNVVSQSHAANLGKTPWITERDVETTNWQGYWTVYPFDPFMRHRSYHFQKQVRVRDVFAPELVLTGWMARLALDGRLDVAPMPFIAGQRSAQWTLTDDEILLPADELVGIFPSWEAQSDGLVNTVKLRIGYDPGEDEFDPSGDFTVRMTQSIAEHKSGDKASQTLEIRSQSIIVGDQLTARNVVDMLIPYLRAVSADYATVTVAVPFTKFGILVGDIVSVTSAFIPDGFGKRGVTNKKAICLGRDWNLDPASGDHMGTLTLWFARDSGRVSGYAPTGRIAGRTDLGGDAWTLQFATSTPRNIAWSEAADGVVLIHFAVGDAIQIVEVDTLTPTIIEGKITAIVDATHCTVQLTSTWSPSSDVWNMRFVLNTEDSSIALQERQAAYCWVADSDGTYLQDTFSGDFPTAREFI